MSSAVFDRATFSQSLQTRTMVGELAPMTAVPTAIPTAAPVPPPAGGGRARRAQPAAATPDVAAMTSATIKSATSLGDVLPTHVNLTPRARSRARPGATASATPPQTGP